MVAHFSVRFAKASTRPMVRRIPNCVYGAVRYKRMIWFEFGFGLGLWLGFGVGVESGVMLCGVYRIRAARSACASNRYETRSNISRGEASRVV